MDKTYDEREKLLEGDLGKLIVERKDLVERIKQAEKEMTDQLQGRAGAPAGDGKLASALRTQRDLLIAQLDRFDGENKQQLDSLKVRQERLRATKEIFLNLPPY